MDDSMYQDEDAYSDDNTGFYVGEDENEDFEDELEEFTFPEDDSSSSGDF